MRRPLLLLPVLLAACVRNPVSGKLELDLLSESEEIGLGKQAKQEAEQTYGVYKDKPELNSYVESVGKRLSTQAERPNLPWSYEIVDDASVNAFALPGGPIFITRGILAHLSSEAEMAAVLGHETGHVAARHSANQMSKQQVAQIGLGLGSALSSTVASASQVAGVGLQVLFLKYSRDDETQADELGFRYMTKVGYDPTQMIPLFEMLDRVSKQEGEGKTPEWLQTHPDPGNRLAETQKRLKTELKGSTQGMKVERDKYLQMIDGIVFGEDPRQGYFKGDTFYHPQLRFQWKMPAGWAHQNTSQVVAAASPKQDAILQLQSAGKMSPEEAAQKVFAQQGVQDVRRPDAAGNDRGSDGLHAVPGQHLSDDRLHEAGRVGFVRERVHAVDGELRRADGRRRAGGQAGDAQDREDRSADDVERVQCAVSVVDQAGAACGAQWD